MALIPDGTSVWLDDIKLYQSSGSGSAVYEINDDEHITVKTFKSEIEISSPQNGRVNIYSASGQLVNSSVVNEGETRISIPNGFYVIQVIKNNQILKSKKVLVQ